MQRFWDKVNKNTENGCWEWTASLTKIGGYGRFKHNRKIIRAHRLSYELNYGKFDETLFVCHKCDNPKCVNPDHLFLGTSQDNMDDMIKKGRNSNGNPIGENNGNSRLSENNILNIKKLIKKGLSNKKIADMYNVSDSMISRIKLGKNWSHIN